ncbi:MAG: 50S ribosomal protein L6 [Candidatus Andersenbacteria bacterium]|nr:50S ribosomal protein L6 [Candidatus Andersenbacteria bacterium]
MSRIGRQAIVLSEGVTAECVERTVIVRGPRGELRYTVHPAMAVTVAKDKLTCAVAESHKQSAALWGTTRARLNNMVIGVRDGFRRELELHGVGYRAQLKGNQLELSVGYSHSVVIPAPDGIRFTVEKDVITVEGIDAVLVGQVAADIRAVRKPEPYKGKGIRYRGEVVRRKVGKVAGSAE